MRPPSALVPLSPYIDDECVVELDHVLDGLYDTPNFVVGVSYIRREDLHLPDRNVGAARSPIHPIAWLIILRTVEVGFRSMVDEDTAQSCSFRIGFKPVRKNKLFASEFFTSAPRYAE